MANDEARMTNDETNTSEAQHSASRHYDLEERTARFGERAIAFVRALPRGPVTNPLITQLVRSATSIGANYCEADDAESKKDFRHKIALCRKESRETMYWLRMIASANESSKEPGRELWREAKELNLIFASIVRKCDAANSQG